jgi:hypothetical protein
LARSFSDAPRASRERIRRSSDTEGSPVSIFATRDWLDLMSLASAVCESFRPRLRLRRLSLNRSFSSTYIASSGVSLRKSSALPSFQPLFFNSTRFVLRIVVVLQSSLRRLNCGLGCLCRFLLEHLSNNNRVEICSVNKPPRRVSIDDSKLVAPSPNSGHWSRVRHGKRLTSLKSTHQESCLQPGRFPERRRLDLAFKPYKRFVFRTHQLIICQI